LFARLLVVLAAALAGFVVGLWPWPADLALVGAALVVAFS
jgi:hypothetical protein